MIVIEVPSDKPTYDIIRGAHILAVVRSTMIGEEIGILDQGKHAQDRAVPMRVVLEFHGAKYSIGELQETIKLLHQAIAVAEKARNDIATQEKAGSNGA